MSGTTIPTIRAMSGTTIRPAREADLPALGRLGAELARAHHGWDPQRFFLEEPMEEGYAWWLGKELANPRAVVLAAVRRAGRREEVVGYAYGRIERRDWNALRDRCGAAIDLIVDPSARGAGVGRRLVTALVEALEAKGAPRVVLFAAAKNRGAQRLFRSLGFRPTMVEMTREPGARAATGHSALPRRPPGSRPPGRRTAAPACAGAPCFRVGRAGAFTPTAGRCFVRPHADQPRRTCRTQRPRP
jgi:ribosomal protein S18 acetylase RimI-like enzyme